MADPHVLTALRRKYAHLAGELRGCHAKAAALENDLAIVAAATIILMLQSSYRAALRSVADLCERNGLAFKVAALPIDQGRAHKLRFDQRSMARTFKQGFEMARSGTLWSAHPPLRESAVASS
jgi:hypothetical protein